LPELPEVETVRRGIAPAMEGRRFAEVDARRRDLRFPFPRRFAARLQGAEVEPLDRRGKYIIAPLSTGEALVLHLGMSGRFTVEDSSARRPGDFVHANPCDVRHDHVVFVMKAGDGATARITYNDPRRFGFMDLVDRDRIEESRHFKGMGPEPLGNQFTADALNSALRGKTATIKAALLDQRVVAGLGNIYACEALYRARISPRRRAASVAGVRGERLHKAIIGVLRDAIEAGGSSLRDFASADGDLGYFQHAFDVYGREGEACRSCGAPIRRLTQTGRSTFFCSACQR
jgi:formamidopyrimidine-DNA glycosylase